MSLRSEWAVSLQAQEACSPFWPLGWTPMEIPVVRTGREAVDRRRPAGSGSPDHLDTDVDRRDATNYAPEKRWEKAPPGRLTSGIDREGQRGDPPVSAVNP